MVQARVAIMAFCSSEPDARTCIDCRDFTNPNVRVMESDRNDQFCTKCLKTPAVDYDNMSTLFNIVLSKLYSGK